MRMHFPIVMHPHAWHNAYMNRLSEETLSTSAARYIRENGEAPPEYGYCLGCKETVEASTLSHDNLCEECVVAIADEQMEVADAALVSACCGAELKAFSYDFGVSQETGYSDSGSGAVCAKCGDETEPMLQILRPAPPVPEVEEWHRNPIKMQGELFLREVA